MSFSITTAFVQQFTSVMHFLSAQTVSRFRDTVRTESGVTGKSYEFERLGHSDPIPTSRHGDTYIANDVHDRKTAYLADYQKGLLIDKLDKLKLLIDPQSVYAQNIGYAFARLFDKVVYDVAKAPYFASTYGKVITETGTNSLNFEKVLQAKTFFDQKEVPEGQRIFAYTAETAKYLLQDNRLTSADYNTVKVLVEGSLPPDMTWMGFKWRRINSTHVTNSANSASDHLLAAWSIPSMGMAIAQEVQVEIDKRPDKQNAYQVYGTMSLGGVFIEPEVSCFIETYAA